MLRQLNSLVIQNVGVSGFFFTLAAARINRGGRTMEFAGAGHPPAMIVQPGAEPRLLPSRSMILGTLPDAVGADATLYTEIEPGDRIVLYTDGLTDVFDRVEKCSKWKDYRTSFAKRRSSRSTK